MLRKVCCLTSRIIVPCTKCYKKSVVLHQGLLFLLQNAPKSLLSYIKDYCSLYKMLRKVCCLTSRIIVPCTKCYEKSVVLHQGLLFLVQNVTKSLLSYIKDYCSLYKMLRKVCCLTSRIIVPCTKCYEKSVVLHQGLLFLVQNVTKS